MSKQTELPGTESPQRNPELHALGLELYELQQERMDLTKREKGKRLEIAALLHDLGLQDYSVDGVDLWIEPGKEKVRVRVGAGDGDDEDEEAPGA